MHITASIIALLLPCLLMAQPGVDNTLRLVQETEADSTATTLSVSPVYPTHSIPEIPQTLLRYHVRPIPQVRPLHYGFFCRLESNIASKSILAPRFRLGSVEYVDRLEGKIRYPQRSEKNPGDARDK